MEKCYYTVTPDGDVMRWNPGVIPTIYMNAQCPVEGWQMQGLMSEFEMIYVPWSVVELISN